MNLLLTGKYFDERSDFLAWLRKQHTAHTQLDPSVVFEWLDNPNNQYDAIVIDEYLFSSIKQTIDFAWGLHRNYPELPTILVISPRDNYEDIFSLYQKGGLFEVIERYQIDSKSQFSQFKAILFRIEQTLNRNALIKDRFKSTIFDLKEQLKIVKSEISKDIEEKKHQLISYLYNCLKLERKIFIKEREIFKSIIFKGFEAQNELLFNDIKNFEKLFLGESDTIKMFLQEVIKLISSTESLIINGKSSSEIRDLAISIYLFRSFQYEIPFVEFDCNLVNDDDFDSIAFGHFYRSTNQRFVTTKGKEKIGKLEQANNGILFINNIDRLSIRNQEKLFVALKSGYIIPLGGYSKEHREEINFTLLIGTTRSLHTMISKGEFKWHLYNYISQGQSVKLPVFNEYKEDFRIILHYIIINLGANIIFDESAIEFLSNQKWIDGKASVEHFVSVYLESVNYAEIKIINAFEVEKIYNRYIKGFEISENNRKLSLYDIHLNTKTISTVRKHLDFLEEIAGGYFADFQTIKTVDLDKLAHRDFHETLEKNSTRGRKRIKDNLVVHRFKEFSNGKINPQRLAVKYLMNLNLEKWPLLRRVILFKEIMNENIDIFGTENETNIHSKEHTLV